MVEGRTKSLTSVLVKIYVLLPMSGMTSQVPHECLGQNLSLPTFVWKDEPSHQQVPRYKIQVHLPMGGRTNQATSKWLGKKFKSFYLRVEGQTKSLTSVLVEI